MKCGQRNRPTLVGTLALLIAASLLASSPVASQTAATLPPIVSKDSVVVPAWGGYAAGGFRRWLLGDDYRDIWGTPIKVPVLDLRSYAGGLKPTKEGGGKQTKSLRFIAPDSSEYVFRSVHKSSTILPEAYKHTVIWSIVTDQGSASHPTGGLAADPLMTAAGVLHPHPVLAMMPDDTILGEFRKEYAGLLGEFEEYPEKPKDSPGFAGATHFMDSDTLLARINRDPGTQVDARALLTARLMDLLLGDNDRHPDQWKWARFKGSDSVWVPIARDRDKVFLSYQGFLMNLARKALPSLVTFESAYPDPSALFSNAGEFDRRLLGGLDKSVWDSVAASITHEITDSLIDASVRAMPPEYAPSSLRLAQILRARRDALPQAAGHYYSNLAAVAEIHGTDADDRATVVRSGDGLVDVSIQSANNPPWFHRRYDARETTEIRLYLHGGDDRAVVTGAVAHSIPVRIIGGNGNNVLIDSSSVGGGRNPTRLYDVGSVEGVKYARDTLDEQKNVDDAFNHYFNRRPWIRAYGELIPPQRDRGVEVRPTAGVHTQRGLGVVPRIGLARYAYGFRTVPYSSMMEADFAYSLGSNRFAIGTSFDKRFESSEVHVPVTAGMTQLEVVQFHGFGNDVPDLRGSFYDVRQKQWQFRPAVGLSLNQQSDISLGPVVRYTATDSVAHRFVSAERPYGFGNFGEVGVRAKLHYDTRVVPDTTRPRAVVELTGSGYPSAWDVASAYESLEGFAATYLTFPVLTKPVLAVRAGGKKLFGDFPFFDAAFLGGSNTLRTEERQRYAGDASLFGTTELRVPVAKFPLILPLDVGVIGFMDAGRVYVDGDSPGGWHSAAGGGLWVGFLNPGISGNILFTNSHAHRVVTNLGFAF